MAESVDRVIKVISSPIEARDETEMGAVIPWLRRTSQLLKGLEKPVLYDILRNCDYQRCQKNDVIIRQGDIGEIFYIILRGTVSVYIDSQMSGEDSIAAVGATPPSIDKRGKKKRAAIKPASPVKKISGANRAKFGKFIVKFEPGKSFGEIALLTKGSIRNASIVVDEETDFLVVHRSLFNRCLKVHEEREFAAIRDFVDTHPFFANWQRRLKRFLEMSVRKEVFEYNSVIAKQGDPVTALYFIYHGQADIIVDPSRHKKQFRRLWPFEAVTDLYAQEFEWLRESRKEAIARKYGNDPAILQTRSDNLTVRRTEGYAAAERLIHGKTVTLCSVTDMEVIGDTEVVSNLETYMQSVVCSAATQVYILDMKNYERLIMKKNPATLEVIKDIVSDKLLNRMSTLQGKQVPLMKYLHFKLHEENFQRAKELPPLKTTKHLPDNELLQKYLVKSFIEGKSQICEPHVPGMTYFQNLMQDKARIRENIRINQGIKRNREKLYSDKMKNRQPRSSTALKEALELLEEEDMIAWREHMGKDFLEMIVPPTKMLTEPSATAPKPLSSWRVQRRLKRPEKITFGDTPHSNEKQGTEVNNGTVLEAANEDLSACDAQVSKPIATESPLEVGVNGDANSQGEAVRSEQKISVQATNSDQYSDNLEQTDESASTDRKSSSSEMPSDQTLQIIPEKSSVPSDSTNIEPDQPTEDREAQQGDGNLGNQKLDLAPLMSDSEADIAKPNTSETELIASMELEEETESRDLEHVPDTIPNDADLKSKVDVDDSDVIKPAQNRVVPSKPVMITHLTAIREESFIHSEPAKQPSPKKPKKKKTTTLTKDSNTCSYVVIHEDTPTKEQSKSIFHALYGGDESQQDEETESSEDGDSKQQDSATDEAEKIQQLADQLEKGNDETNGDAESVPQRKRKRTQKQEVSHVDDETEQSVSTRAWGLTRQFVQQKIEKKKQQSTLYDDKYSEYKDYETSDRTLNFLENRLRAFHLKYSNSRRPIKLPKLRRFKYNQDELYRRLRQGGRVRIMRRKCDLAQSDYKIKDHQHVHYHMVPKLVDVQDVRKTRMVMQFMVDNNVRKTTEGDRFIVQGEMDRN